MLAHTDRFGRSIMNTVQIEHGYLKIANELQKAFCSFRIPGECRMVLDAIIYKTYGFNKKEDWISHTQLIELTGLRKSNLSRSLSKLITNKLVIKSDNKLRLNKNYTEWVSFKKLSKVRVTKDNNTILQKTREKISEENLIRLQEFIAYWNSKRGTRFKVTEALHVNFNYWAGIYTQGELLDAVTKIRLDEWWDQKITPEIFLRRKNQNKEEVDYIAKFINYKQDSQLFELSRGFIERN